MQSVCQTSSVQQIQHQTQRHHQSIKRKISTYGVYAFCSNIKCIVYQAKTQTHHQIKHYKHLRCVCCLLLVRTLRQERVEARTNKLLPQLQRNNIFFLPPPKEVQVQLSRQHKDESRLFGVSFSFPVNRPLLVHVRIVFEEEPAE